MQTWNELYTSLNYFAKQIPDGQVTYFMPDAWTVYQAVGEIVAKFDQPTIFEFAGGYGFSSAIILMALQDAHSNGKFYTVEVDGTRTPCLRRIIAQFNVTSMVFEQPVQDVAIPDTIHFYLQDGEHYSLGLFHDLELLTWNKIPQEGMAYIHDVGRHEAFTEERTWLMGYFNRHPEWNFKEVEINEWENWTRFDKDTGSNLAPNGCGIIAHRK